MRAKSCTNLSLTGGKNTFPQWKLFSICITHAVQDAEYYCAGIWTSNLMSLCIKDIKLLVKAFQNFSDFYLMACHTHILSLKKIPDYDSQENNRTSFFFKFLHKLCGSGQLVWKVKVLVTLNRRTISKNFAKLRQYDGLLRTLQNLERRKREK